MPGIDSSAGGVVYGTGDYYTSVLNDTFLPAMADIVIYPNARLKRIRRVAAMDHMEGKQVKYPIHTDDAVGVTALGADGYLPEADAEHFARYAIDMKHIYARARFDGISSDASKTRLASWLDIVASEMEAKAKIVARARQRMYSAGDGSGRLCEVVSYSAPTLTVRIPTIESSGTISSTATRFVKAGQLLACVTSGGTITAILKVSSVTATTIVAVNSSTYSILGTPGANDYVVTLGQFLTVATTAVKDTGFKNEPMGFSGILDDTNPPDGNSVGFQGVDSTTAANAWHRALIYTGSGVARPLTNELMDQVFLGMVELGDIVPSAIFCDFVQWRKYAALQLPDKRINTTGGKVDTLDGGYGGLSYNGVPLIPDRDCWANRMEFTYEDNLRIFEMAPLQWMDKDGSIYQRIVDKDAYQATIYVRETLAIDERNKQALLTDLAS